MKNFQIKIQRIYTDMNGVIIDKSTVPLSMQQKVPFYLFSNFDKNGGYKIGQQVKPPINGMYFLYSYVNDGSYNFLNFQIGNTINKTLQIGDSILVFGDDPILPNFLCHVVMHSDYASYASFVANLQGKICTISQIQYSTDNEQNWLENFNVTSADDFGTISDKTIQPLTYRDPYQYTSGFLTMNVNLSLDDKTGIESYMLFSTDLLELTFAIDLSINLSLTNSTNGNTNQTAILFETR